MKKYLSIVLFGLLFVWACSDDSENSNSNNDNEAITTDDNVIDNQNNTPGDEEQVVIDADFKAFLDEFKEVSLPYSENPGEAEEFPKIPIKAQVKYLSKAEDLSESELKEMADYTDFYYISHPVSTKKFHAIVYGRFEMGSVYYFLCTYNNKGELISHIDFAAYEMMGAGPQAGQEFSTKGNLDKSFEVTVRTTEETLKYKIDESGVINKI